MTAASAVIASNPCDTCGACCRSYVVPVFGHDLWQICTHQRLAPEQFVLIYPEKEARPEAFRLEAGGQRYSLALDKKGRFELKKSCIFLVELPGGHARCGVYDHRPVVCQGYPMSMWSRVVAQRSETLCPPDSWSLPQITNPRWVVALTRLAMHLDIYSEVITRWNARVEAHPERGFALPEFFSYLLNVYDRLDAISQEIGEAGMAAVEATWPTFPRPNFDTPEAFAAVGDVPWMRYFIEVRRIIDAIYPEVPPQPPALRANAAPGTDESAGNTSTGPGIAALATGTPPALTAAT
jgi:Fe-S-cluster containining protein